MADALRQEPDTIDAPADAPAPDLSGTGDNSPVTGENSPVDAPSGPVTGNSAQDDVDLLDKLLAEYDQSISRTAPAPPPAGDPQLDPAAGLDLDALQRGADEQAWRHGETVAENSRLKSEAAGAMESAQRSLDALQHVEQILRQENEQRDFGKFASDIQRKMPSHVPPDYAELALTKLAANEPLLRLAWDFRNSNPAALAAERDHVHALMIQIQINPNADQGQLAGLKDRAEQLSVAMNAREILAEARTKLLRDAKAVPKPIDDDLSRDHEMIVQAIRGAGGKVRAEPPPNYGAMSDQEFTAAKRQFGF
jgi:hypothetical protein